MKKKILVFIPSYNIENQIYSTFNSIPFKKISKLANIQYLIINDNSKDNTNGEVKKIFKKYKNKKIFLINNKKNLGYGGVQKIAFNYGIYNKFDYCVMLHGDGQYNPKYLPTFIKSLIKYCKYDPTKNSFYLPNVCVAGIFGSRMINWKDALKGNMPLYKFIGNKFLTLVQNILLFTKFSEFHSGYRSYDLKVLKLINYKNLTNEFHFDTEIIIELLKNNFTIKEFPIKTHYGNEVSHLKSIPYGVNILKITMCYSFKKLIYSLFKFRKNNKRL